MINNIDKIKNSVKDFYRSNLFYVDFITPFSSDDIKFLVQAFNIPTKDVSYYEKKFFGETIYIPLQRNYSGEINITFLNDIHNKAYNLIEKWIEELHKTTNIVNYIKQCRLRLTSFYKDKEKVLIFYNVFPINRGDISYNYESIDTIESFDVTFRYSSFQRRI